MHDRGAAALGGPAELLHRHLVGAARPGGTAVAEITQATTANPATAYHFEGSPSVSAAAIVGVKPASAKPNWVPMAIPESRTWVGKYSA